MTFPQHVGLALCLGDLRHYADWLKAGQRDIEMQDITYGDVMEGDWKKVARDIRELLDGHTGRVGVHGPFWHLNIAPRDPAVQRLVQDRLNLGLDFAAEVGGTHMVVHSPFDYFGHPFAVPGYRLPAELERVRQTMMPIVKRAESQGVTLVVENIYDLNPQPLLDLVRMFDSPNVRLSVDVGHAHLMTQRGGPPPQLWLTQAGEWLGHVHICDNDTTNDQHLAPGKGTVHWPGVLAALAAAPAQARLLVEVKSAELAQSRDWVEQLGNG